MKYQYIYEFLAQLAIKHKVFLHHKSMLTEKEQVEFGQTLRQLSIDNHAHYSTTLNNIVTLTLPYNVELLSLLSKLKELGFLTYSINFRSVVILINIFAYSSITVHSKPSRPIFKKVTLQSVWTKDSGAGFSIMRTSKGFRTSIEAKELRIGGELLFTIQ